MREQKLNPYNKLFNNSLIFAIGNLGSKVIAFVLVPLYTYYLTTEQYGTVDVIISTSSMLLPIVSLSIFDAVLRFVMDKKLNRSTILTNSIFISSLGFIVLITSYPIIKKVSDVGYINFLFIILVLQSYQIIFSQYARGIGLTKVFAFNGVLQTFCTGIFNIIFLVYFELGVAGYFFALIISYSISILYLIIKTQAFKIIKISEIDKGIITLMLKYSIPLIPHSLMWWLINASSRFFISYFLGLTTNGLFAVASKIPALVTIMSQIFSQAWHLSAIEEFDSKNNDKFYSSVFAHLSSFMYLGSLVLIIALKPMFFYLFSEDYFVAWMAVPFLLMGAVFSAFSDFIGSIYVASKKTSRLFKTSLMGGGISIVLNFLLIPTFGLIGAGITSLFSFMVIFINRYLDTRHIIDIKISWKHLMSLNLIIFLQIIISFLKISYIFEFCFGILLLIVMSIICKDTFNIVIKVAYKFLKNKS